MAEVPDTVDDAIAALSETPTTDDVFLGTRAFSAREVASAAVASAAGGGGGGSLPSQWTVDDAGNVVIAPDEALDSISSVHIVAASDSQDGLTVADSANPDDFNFAVDPYGYAIGLGFDASQLGDFGPALRGACYANHDVPRVRDVFQARMEWQNTALTLVRLLGNADFVISTNGDISFKVAADGGVHAANLPTSDPAVVGQIWNDAGTLKVSAGP